ASFVQLSDLRPELDGGRGLLRLPWLLLSLSWRKRRDENGNTNNLAWRDVTFNPVAVPINRFRNISRKRQ
ncbi:hypothetical protein LAJ57_13840, partial [Streptococcus pneumoniae]|uniref:hypothetical protein n=1 Tax=Streptococcus pneumoniae TaxID=1313 RepID=UPI001CBD8423